MQINNKHNIFFWAGFLHSLGLDVDRFITGWWLIFEPLMASTLAVPSNGTATVEYRLTNQSINIKHLILDPLPENTPPAPSPLHVSLCPM